MNRGQLKTRVARMVGMALGTSDDTAADTALLEELANEAVRDILARTRVHVRRVLVPLDVGATEFEIDQALLDVWGIERGTEEPGTLYKGNRDFLASDEYAVVGLNRIALGLAGSGENLSLWYTPRPTEMTDDAHDPSFEAYGLVPSEHHRAIVDYMCWHAADKMGDQGAGRGEKYRIMYEGQNGQGMLGSDLGRIKWATNTRAGASTVKSPRRVLRGDLTPSYWQG